MTETDMVGLLMRGMLLALWLSLPPILVASLVGTLLALLQALTQIQEQTLSFAVKLIAVGITIALTARWMGGEIFNYTIMLFEAMTRVGR
jgi:type III secretion protein S